MHILLTGHTGFKGAWLTLLLKELGHTVSGVALDPNPVSLFNQVEAHKLLAVDLRADIRERSTMRDALAATSPDALIHLAAQSLVRESYRDPRLTIETNVLGTLNVLEAGSRADSLKAQLVVTTDKVYRNVGRDVGYAENDPLGGDDVYSASKAMADIMTHAWVTSFSGPNTAVTRAGNVIGGGDYGTERLIPDTIGALTAGSKVRLRYPGAVRPWQHVLDCLNGYLAVVDHLITPGQSGLDGGAWNIGPGIDSFKTVQQVTSLVGALWGIDDAWEATSEVQHHEAELLALDATRARVELGWRNMLDFDTSVGWTVDWYKTTAAGQDPRQVTLRQVRAFLDLRRAPHPFKVV